MADQNIRQIVKDRHGKAALTVVAGGDTSGGSVSAFVRASKPRPA